jgi:hypothetical protein
MYAKFAKQVRCLVQACCNSGNNIIEQVLVISSTALYLSFLEKDLFQSDASISSCHSIATFLRGASGLMYRVP